MAATYNNVPVAVIDPNFSTQLGKLKEGARRIYLSDTGSINPNDQREWQLPNPNGWDGNLFNLSGPTSISAAFDRTLPNLIYIRALTKGPPVVGDGGAPEGEGRVGDCEVEKIQIDYLAALERAFRFRHQTSVRCTMHAAIRRKGHSSLSDSADLTDLGGGVAPAVGDVVGPVGGIFTSMLRYLQVLLSGAYNEGPVDITHGPTGVTQDADGTVFGTED